MGHRTRTLLLLVIGYAWSYSSSLWVSTKS